MKLSLSILTVDYLNVGKSLESMIKKCDYLHLDVMDGNFVPNISFGPAFIKSLRKIGDIPFDTHLMIQNPIDYIKVFAEAGSDLITIHPEASSDVMECINLIHSLGKKAGISIKPKTTVEEIKEYLPYVDLVLIMSVEPGFGGQKFMMSAVEKAKELKGLKIKNNYNYLISMDGGINKDTLVYVKDYLDLCVVGSYIVNADDPMERIDIITKM